ncbi:MAG TPA: outer membrane beta-barrel protein [Gemmatimonadaceae bacterium]|nr:outer membrane beta-barrel protein [Gemmatimonadaceae bacterium]
MNRFLVSAALVMAAAAPAAAQSSNDAGAPVTAGHGSFYASPYVGYLIYGDLFESRDGNIEISNENAALFGGQVGYSFSPNFTLIGNFGYSKSSFTLEDSRAGTTQIISDDIGIFLYDANLQFRLPFVANRMGSWIAPVAQIGAGAMKYSFDTDDLRGAGQTQVALNFGLGADFQLMKTLGVRVMAKDYITSLNWGDDNSFATDIKDGQTAHNWGLTLGLNFGF